MTRLKNSIALTLLVLFSSCQNKYSDSYAIRDFRKSIQPFLLHIVSKGIVRHYDSTEIKNITDDELVRLGKSENPVLRATAFREMLARKSFNQFDVLMMNLNDTAIIASDAGEFGIIYSTVSDDILQNASWKTKEAKHKTIDEVLTKHNHLRSAYTILKQLEPQEKYYSYIKDMARRSRYLSDDGYETGFEDIEYALYGLAKFKKKEDVKLIKDKMMQNIWKLGTLSFRLLEEFPDTAYFDVLQTYHRQQFYTLSGHSPGGFSGHITDRASPTDFIQALAIQQNDRSAGLLDTMLNRLPLQTCMPHRKSAVNEIISAIWQYPCPAYKKLQEKTKPASEKTQSWPVIIPLPLPTATKRAIRWDN